MPSVFTIQGAADEPRKPKVGDCKCVYNPRTKQSAELCYVGKGKGRRTGWKFMKGGNKRCTRR